MIFNPSHQEVFICFYLQVNSNIYKTGTNYLLHLTANRNMQRRLPLQLDVTIGQIFTLMMTIIIRHFLAFLKE
jgi:predicted membrane-bound dolichyl-phosphate-mannose-protein mannosyltransferase